MIVIINGYIQVLKNKVMNKNGYIALEYTYNIVNKYCDILTYGYFLTSLLIVISGPFYIFKVAF